MKREWKPGDVAKVTRTLAGNKTTGPVMRVRSAVAGEVWWGPDGWIGDATAKDARPLVVIDPEDREQVERLHKSILRIYGGQKVTDVVNNTALMQAALREFANPTPPKPDEPTGLGAVVEDAEGIWVRTESGEAGWCPSGIPGSVRYRCWADFPPAVRVLSEGVQP